MKDFIAIKFLYFLRFLVSYFLRDFPLFLAIANELSHPGVWFMENNANDAYCDNFLLSPLHDYHMIQYICNTVELIQTHIYSA